MKHELIDAFLRAQEEMRGVKLADKVSKGLPASKRIVVNTSHNLEEPKQQEKKEVKV